MRHENAKQKCGSSGDIYENKGQKTDILDGPGLFLKTKKIWVLSGFVDENKGG